MRTLFEVDSYHMTPPPQSHSRTMHQPTGTGYDPRSQMAHNTGYGSSGHRGDPHIPSGYGHPPSYTSPPPSMNTHHGQTPSSNRNHSPSSNPNSFSPASVNRRPLYNDYSKNQSLPSPENKSTGNCFIENSCFISTRAELILIIKLKFETP